MLLNKFILLILVFFSVTVVSALEIKKTTAHINIPIYNNDIATARNKALGRIKIFLVLSTVKDLLHKTLFEKYKIFLNKKITYSKNNFILSLNIIEQNVEKNNFFINVVGKINIPLLKSFLREQNLPLRTDPWYTLTLLTNQVPQEWINALNQQLSVFNIKATTFYEIDQEFLQKNNDFSNANNIKNLFNKYNDHPMIFIFKNDHQVLSSKKSIDNLNLNILRKSDYSLITKINFKGKINTTSETNESLLNNFLEQINYKTLQVKKYDKAPTVLYHCIINTKLSPYLRKLFETEYFHNHYYIKNYSLFSISNQKIEYNLNIKSSPENFINFLTRANKNFIVEIQPINNHRPFDINLHVAPQYNIFKITPLKYWNNNDNSNLNKLIENFYLTQEDPKQWTPQFLEVEPNNNYWQVNLLPNKKTVLGRLFSRLDQDIYKVKNCEDCSIIKINLWRLERTELLTSLKIYDDQLNFLYQYNLSQKRKENYILYKFSNNIPPVFYLRLSDRLGYILGEIGGFKNFYYLLKIEAKKN